MSISEREELPAVRQGSPATSELPNLISLLAFFSITAVLFRSTEFALIVTASLGFHELGHAVMLSWYRLPWRISFSLIGAWTWSPRLERARLTELQNVFIHLAGPFFSLVLAMVAISLHHFWQPGDQHLLTLANFSAQVGFLNLLPLGPITDGGKVLHRLVGSLTGSSRRRMAILPLSITVLMLGLYILVELPRLDAVDPLPFLFGLILAGSWMASSLLLEMHAARNTAPTIRQPASSSQVYFLLLVFWDMLVLQLILIARTPFWLSPNYLIGPLQYTVSLVRLVAWFSGSLL